MRAGFLTFYNVFFVAPAAKNIHFLHPFAIWTNGLQSPIPALKRVLKACCRQLLLSISSCLSFHCGKADFHSKKSLKSSVSSIFELKMGS